MRRREFYWSLFDEHEKKQIDGLRTDQIEAVFTVLPTKLLGQFWIWRDGFENWKPFVEFPELLVSLRKHDDREFEAPPPPPKAKVTTKTSSITLGEKSGVTLSGSHPGTKPAPAQPQSKKKVELNVSNSFDFANQTIGGLSLEEVGAGDDRNNRRFTKKLDIRIVTNDHTYENKTVDLSLKGMQLELPLPADLPRYFNVEIRQRNQVIPVVCSEVKPGDGKHRLKIEVNDYASGLLALLLAG